MSVVDILFDATDQPSKNQVRVINDKLDDMLNVLDQGTLIRVFSISAHIGGLSSIEFEMCMPTLPSKTSDFTGNKLFAKRNYEDKFKIPLESAITSILTRPEQETSPIIEALHDYSQKNHPKASTRQVIIFSDLLQNTSDYSVYSESKRLITYPYDVDLNNAQVLVYVLERKGGVRKRQNRSFINDWSKVIGKHVDSLQFKKVRS
ncbi:MAG: hypothetical protein RPS47_07570 [Colwellia sp.]